MIKVYCTRNQVDFREVKDALGHKPMTSPMSSGYFMFVDLVPDANWSHPSVWIAFGMADWIATMRWDWPPSEESAKEFGLVEMRNGEDAGSYTPTGLVVATFEVPRLACSSCLFIDNEGLCPDRALVNASKGSDGQGGEWLNHHPEWREKSSACRHWRAKVIGLEKDCCWYKEGEGNFAFCADGDNHLAGRRREGLRIGCSRWRPKGGNQ